MIDDEYDFGHAWVVSEGEAARAFELTTNYIRKYNEEDEIIQSERTLQEAHMALLNSVVLEIRALRLFMVARFHNEEIT